MYICHTKTTIMDIILADLKKELLSLRKQQEYISNIIQYNILKEWEYKECVSTLSIIESDILKIYNRVNVIETYLK